MQVFSSNAFFKGMTIPKPDRTEPLEEKLPTASHLAMAFLHVRLRSYILPPRYSPTCYVIDSHHTQGCFHMDPNERLTCDELLQHPYFDRYEVHSESRRPNNRHSNRERVRTHCYCYPLSLTTSTPTLSLSLPLHPLHLPLISSRSLSLSPLSPISSLSLLLSLPIALSLSSPPLSLQLPSFLLSFTPKRRL